MAKKLYEVNDEERRLFDLARDGNVNAFTNYYLKGPNTGSWWLPGAKTPNWKRGYARLHRYWLLHDRPNLFDYEDKTFRMVSRHEKTKEFPDLPAFFNNHGFYLLPFAQDLFYDRTDTRTIVGGWGSGKTMNMAASYAVYAAIYEDFLGLSLAPRARQSNEFISIIRGIIRGTLFEKRFLLHYTAGPNAIMRIGNSLVGETRIESFPLLDKSEDVLTLTADCGVVDQAERFDILDTVRKDVGSRFRGLVISSGRPRLGHLTFLANSKYNDLLFNIYDRAEDDPDHYLSLTLKSYDNPYLTDRDLDRYEHLVNTEEEREINLEGKRPIGDGKEFSRDVMRRMMTPDLDVELKQGIDNSWSGYSLQEAKEVGVWEWMLPYKEGHKYLVISDPGTGNPPHRNAYGILVFDISGFPAEPASLAAYIWGFGRGDILNWATRHAELTQKYHAVGSNGFDATGYQSGYDQWMQILKNLMSEKISLAGNNKADCLNSAKMLCSAGRIKLPPSISGLWNQLSRYELPEPPGLRQDLVMTFIMACWWLKRVYWIPLMSEPSYTPSEFTFEEDRYARGTEDRYMARTPR